MVALVVDAFSQYYFLTGLTYFDINTTVSTWLELMELRRQENKMHLVEYLYSSKCILSLGTRMHTINLEYVNPLGFPFDLDLTQTGGCYSFLYLFIYCLGD